MEKFLCALLVSVSCTVHGMEHKKYAQKNKQHVALEGIKRNGMLLLDPKEQHDTHPSLQDRGWSNHFGAWSPNGSLLCTSQWKLRSIVQENPQTKKKEVLDGNIERNLMFWSVTDSGTEFEVEVPRDGLMITAVAYAPHMQWYAVGRAEGMIEIYCAQHKFLTSIQAYINDYPHSSLIKPAVLSLAWSHDGSQLISTSYDGLVSIWDVSNDGCKLSFHKGYAAKNRDTPDSVACAHTSKTFAVALRNGTITLFKQDVKLDISTGDSWLDALAFSHDDTLLASFSKATKYLAVWDTTTGERIYCRSLDELFSSLVFTPDGKKLRLCTGDIVRDIPMSEIKPKKL